MDDNDKDKAMYISLFEQKEKIMQIVKQNKLNAQGYSQMLEKQLQTNKN